jgi:MoaA/NifB/PqqE/SkfB family radical SAM enzyme
MNVEHSILDGKGDMSCAVDHGHSPDKLLPAEFGYFPNATLKVFLTQACNLTCPGCFNNSNLRFLTKPELPWYQLKPEEVKRVMREAKETFNTYRAEFSGGEPTLQFDNLLDYLQYGKELGYRTQVTTNGSIIGAYDAYKEQLRPFLPEILKQISPEEAVQRMVSAGLDNVLISIDTMHTMLDQDFNPLAKLSAKAPTSIVANTIRQLLKYGYGKPHGDGYNALDRYGVRVGMTASGDQWQPSFDLVSDVMAQVGAVLQPERRGKLWVFVTPTGDEITLHRNETADIGFGENLESQQLHTLGETIFTRNCYGFAPRSHSAVSNGINQEIAVNYDGIVSTCAFGSYQIGDIRDHSLKDIVGYVNTEEPPKRFRPGVMMFREVMKIVKESEGTKGWGEAYRRIYAIAQKKGDSSTINEVLSMRSHTGACYALSRNPLFMDYLIEWRDLNSAQ